MQDSANVIVDATDVIESRPAQVAVTCVGNTDGDVRLRLDRAVVPLLRSSPAIPCQARVCAGRRHGMARPCDASNGSRWDHSLGFGMCVRHRACSRAVCARNECLDCLSAHIWRMSRDVARATAIIP